MIRERLAVWCHIVTYIDEQAWPWVNKCNESLQINEKSQIPTVTQFGTASKVGHRRGTGFGAAAWQYVSARIRELNYPNTWLREAQYSDHSKRDDRNRNNGVTSEPSGVAIPFKLSACEAQITVVKTQFSPSNPETIENFFGATPSSFLHHWHGPEGCDWRCSSPEHPLIGPVSKARTKRIPYPEIIRREGGKGSEKTAKGYLKQSQVDEKAAGEWQDARRKAHKILRVSTASKYKGCVARVVDDPAVD
ncbi:hypothetical protein F5888DRAFT_1634899 [Russula emetica]|nr:hypothetical protein F5888DRAFT_1634899 [Russula emetica]